MLTNQRNLPVRLGQIFSKTNQVIKPLLGWAGQSTVEAMQVEARLQYRTKPQLVRSCVVDNTLFPTTLLDHEAANKTKGRCADKRSSQQNAGVQKPQASSFPPASRETSSCSEGRILDIRASASRSPSCKASSKLWKGTFLDAQRPRWQVAYGWRPFHQGSDKASVRP